MPGSNGYSRSVRAALSETRSKFALAEALALDIPPRGRGPADEETVPELLAEARQAIIDAGGEPRNVHTLDEYRRTALWVSGEVSRNFQWVNGASFSAHSEARKRGVTYADFAARPRTVDVIRREAGGAGTDGPAAKVAAAWSPEERAEVARELAKDPEVAAAVVADPEAHIAITKAAGDHIRDTYPVTHGKHREPADDTPRGMVGRLDLIGDIRAVKDAEAKILRAGRAPMARHDETIRALLLSHADWLVNAADLLRSAVEGEDIEAALDKILSEPGE